MMSKIKFIQNPTSNHGRSLHIASQLKTHAAETGGVWEQSEYPKHITELARAAGEEGFDVVVAVGGDGTVHEVINGLMQVPAEKRPALGIIPLGSGNDFAHILGIPDDPFQALEGCLSGKPRTIDIGSVQDENGRLEYFNNTIGIGFDGVVTIRSRKLTNIHGFMMYLVATLGTILLNFKPMDLHIETDSESWDQSTIMLTLGNGPREGGGFMVTPDAKLDDGMLDFVAVRRIPRLTMLRLVPEFMKGTHTHFKPIRMGKCRRMSVTSGQPLYIHCDGEIYSGFETDIRKLEMNLLPNALRFLK